jgi:hypothetical protein
VTEEELLKVKLRYIVIRNKLIEMYQIFGKTRYLYLKNSKHSELNVRSTGFSETLVHLSQATVFHIQEDGKIYIEVIYNTKFFH